VPSLASLSAVVVAAVRVSPRHEESMYKMEAIIAAVVFVVRRQSQREKYQDHDFRNTIQQLRERRVLTRRAARTSKLTCSSSSNLRYKTASNIITSTIYKSVSVISKFPRKRYRLLGSTGACIIAVQFDHVSLLCATRTARQ